MESEAVAPAPKSGVTVHVRCAGCDRVLFEDAWRDLPGLECMGHPAREHSYRVRPWAAIVLTRLRDVAGGAIRDATGSLISVRERPTICSRLCLERVVAEGWPFDGAEIVGTIYPTTHTVGDDRLSRTLGSRSSPIPDVPSDDWVNPHRQISGGSGG